MNLGIYLDTLSNQKVLEKASLLIDNNENNNFSIFYNDIDYNPYKQKCGFFNATELWSFYGTLIVTSFKCLKTSLNIVNNIDIVYYYGLDDKINPLHLAEIAYRKIKVIASDNKKHKEFYRLTGIMPSAVCEDFSKLPEFLTENKNGYQQDINYVYKT